MVDSMGEEFEFCEFVGDELEKGAVGELGAWRAVVDLKLSQFGEHLLWVVQDVVDAHVDLALPQVLAVPVDIFDGLELVQGGVHLRAVYALRVYRDVLQVYEHLLDGDIAVGAYLQLPL
jgi:hypothetical protein